MTSYVGGKQRLGKRIHGVLENLNKLAGPFQTYYEPFLGMGGVMRRVKFCPTRVGSDRHVDVIEMWKELQKGWEPPKAVTRDEFYEVKYNRDNFPPHVRGYVGHGFSFAGLYFGAFKPGDHKEAGRLAYTGVKKALEDGMQDVCIFSASYDDVPIPERSSIMIYCDPPYATTTHKVGKGRDVFDHTKFWNWVRRQSKNHLVVVSEFQAPSDFVPIWSYDRTLSMSNYYKDRPSRKVTEKLFIHKDWLKKLLHRTKHR